MLPARVRKPQDKPSAENGVQNVEREVIVPLLHETFFLEAAANRAIGPLLDDLNDHPMVPEGKSRRQLFEELELPALQPLPQTPYEFAAWKTLRVNLNDHVAFE